MNFISLINHGKYMVQIYGIQQTIKIKIVSKAIKYVNKWLEG